MNRHKMDSVSLIFGLLFAGIGLVLISDDVSLRNLDLRVVWPALLVLAGLAIFATTRKSKEPPAS